MSEDYRMLIASNLKSFRLERGLTQEQLAEKAGVSAPCVKKIENGRVAQPETRTLAALAFALRRSIGDFYRVPKTLKAVRFRAKKSFSGNGSNSGKLKRSALVSSCATWIERYCYLENELGRQSAFCLERPKVGERVDVPAFAAEVRSRLGLDAEEPIVNVADVLQRSGVKFWFNDRRPCDDVFGLAFAESPQATGVVVFNAPEISVERRIFSTIHEFAHLLLHAQSFDADVVEENEREEKEADLFAGHFLAPESAFQKRWDAANGLAFVDRVLCVKRYFRVSYKTVLRRLVDDGKADSSIYMRFNVAYNSRYRKDLKKHREPAPLLSFDAPEDRFRNLVYEATLREKISPSRAAEFLGTTVAEIYELFNAPEDE